MKGGQLRFAPWLAANHLERKTVTTTKQQKFKQRHAARQWYAAGRMIDWQCPRCGGNSMTLADKCRAPLDDPCPGFLRTEEVYREFEANYAALVGETGNAQNRQVS